ncbi:MAG: prolipoprotein diacylglyceryl transferase [Candidatus Doudnabacteria bacterium]|nr:prolipoprotein diacylglyceryl transferase [Candidatus Doudnabacteria bacterium]
MIQNTKAKAALIGALFMLAMFLWPVFSGSLILPQTFQLGPFTIHYYGLIMALAITSGFYLAKKRSGKFGLNDKVADDMIFWLIIGGFIGARLYHVFSSFGYYQNHFLDIFQVWHGGLSIYGAVLGGLLALWLYSLFHASGPMLHILDWLTPSLILGQIIGRFGNLFNYEAFGYPTDLPWKMYVPEAFRPDGYANRPFFHPWFLYEQIGLTIILFAIGKIGGSEKQTLFTWYFLLYNVLRFGLEFLRVDSPFALGFRQNALVSLVLAITAAMILLVQSKRVKC